MNLENEKIPSSVNAPDSYHKEFESRLLQRLGISADVITQNQGIGSEFIKAPAVASVPLSTAPTVELNPKTPQVEPQKIARKQDPETIKSEAVSKEIEQIGNINIEPMVVSTNENPEWVNFADTESSDLSNIEGIVIKSNIPAEFVNETSDKINENNIDLFESEIDDKEESAESEVPAWNDIATPTVSTSQVNIPWENENPPAAEAILETTSENVAVASEGIPPIVVHRVPETLIVDSPVSESPNKLDDAPKETKLYNQSEPGLDTLEPPPAPFAPIAGRVQNTSSSPGWIGIAASVAAIVAAYFIWVAIQPSAEEETPAVVAAPVVVEQPAVVATPKDTVPAGIRLVENYILDEKLEKYKEPNVFSVDKMEDLPERSRKALNDLEHHNIAVFDMEDVLFEDLDLLIQ